MTTQTMWWIVASDKDQEHGWHWDEFFEHSTDPEHTFDWGGPDWIRSSASFGRVQRMRNGDPIVAYQAGEGVLGFARLASNGRVTPSSGNYDSFDLAPTPVVRLRRPIPYEVIRDLPGARDNFEFVKFHQGSVFGVTTAGKQQLLSLAAQFNPSHAGHIAEFSRSRAG